MTQRKPEPTLSPVSAVAIEAAMSEMQRLIEGGFNRQALLHGFAVLEAIGRRVLAPRLAKAHAVGSIIETLTFDGLLSQDDAVRLRALVPLRNSVVHGGLDVVVSGDDLIALRAAIDDVWREAQTPEAAE